MTHQWKRRPIDIFPKVSTGKKFNSSLNPFQEECAYIEQLVDTYSLASPMSFLFYDSQRCVLTRHAATAISSI
ncbi:hypothetical protein V1477_015304 [Vespula maculifrons]|uniref:Uncharacterized protein n=1 Tax=Vespula maculifrons TaxID=7453 RepID=A0ABD2BFF8_VESMC